uniref:Uncharacterized protein n=1 Tax=Zea mays TaxID=4577 RepID=C0PDN6_MAIZE|nr:unknown [Zea mays]
MRRGGERGRDEGDRHLRAVAGAGGGRPGLALRPVVGARLRPAGGAAGGRGVEESGGALRRLRGGPGDKGPQDRRRRRCPPRHGLSLTPRIGTSPPHLRTALLFFERTAETENDGIILIRMFDGRNGKRRHNLDKNLQDTEETQEEERAN